MRGDRRCDIGGLSHLAGSSSDIRYAWRLIIAGLQGQYEAWLRPRLPRWLLVAATLLPAIGAGSAPSFAQATSGENATMSPVDQAVRTGDFGRAATLLRKLADAGNPEAQYRLASLYRTGRGVPQDDLLAFKWMKAAAERNHGSALNFPPG
jgi:TPR repeat protein